MFVKGRKDLSLLLRGQMKQPPKIFFLTIFIQTTSMLLSLHFKQIKRSIFYNYKHFKGAIYTGQFRKTILRTTSKLIT